MCGDVTDFQLGQVLTQDLARNAGNTAAAEVGHRQCTALVDQHQIGAEALDQVALGVDEQQFVDPFCVCNCLGLRK